MVGRDRAPPAREAVDAGDPLDSGVAEVFVSVVDLTCLGSSDQSVLEDGLVLSRLDFPDHLEA